MLFLLANPDAWPKAVLLRNNAYDVALPIHPVARIRARCAADYAPLLPLRLERRTSTCRRSTDKYLAHVPRSESERLLFISAMYRPEWSAETATASLPVHSRRRAFLGVTVPPGVHRTIAIVFHGPRVQIALTWFSNLVLFGTLAGNARADAPDAPCFITEPSVPVVNVGSELPAS
jgi:hypothetical protein